ncbi:putative membrane protein [Vibrio anguillarum]|nr:putative membrane protein [Vibrio anguillarum]
MNFEAVIIALIFIATIIFEQKQTKEPISINTMLLIYGSLYSLGSMLDERTINKDIAYMLIFSVYILYFSSKVSEFTLNRLLSEYKINSECFYDKKLFKNLILLLIFFCMLSFVYVFLFRISFFDFLNTTRAGRSLLMHGMGPLMFFKDTLAAIYIFSIVILYSRGYSSFYLKVAIFTGVFTVIYSLATISRAHFVFVALSTIYMLSYSRRIKSYQANILMSFGVIFAISWKWLISSIIIKGELNLETFTIDIPSEFVHWSNITYNISNEAVTYGASFFDAIVSMVYPFYDVTALSVWYVKKYEPTVAEIGGGRGFSLLAESILNFGYIGIPMVFSILGVFFWLY